MGAGQARGYRISFGAYTGPPGIGPLIFGVVQFTVPLSIVVVVVSVVVIETANWLYKSIDYDNDNRFADNDNEEGRQTDTHASMVLNQAPLFF